MTDDVFYKAMAARDQRFDGKFFVGVKTTGIYCRPICPARPRRRNVIFFESALKAETAGYRPCLRCRPEAAPLSPGWMGTSAVVQRALRTIATQRTLAINEVSFAAHFGVTPRHLRRLFQQELGQTPKQIMDVHRLNFSRRLVVETTLPMTTVVLMSGFQSLRRFNDAFKKRFRRPPSALRKSKSREAQGIQLSLSYRPPFCWDTLLSFYQSHRIHGLETITQESYERVFRMSQSVGRVRVTHNAAVAKLLVDVMCDDPSVLYPVIQNVRQMFDLDLDPLVVSQGLLANRDLAALCKKHPGLRIARGWDPFESGVCTILGQMVSVAQARNLVAQMVLEYGEPAVHPESGERLRLFPNPQTLAHSDLAKVSTTQIRRRAIQEFAKRVLNGTLNLRLPPDHETLVKDLLSIPGVGPWSAEFISLRAFGNTDAFPASDLILKRALQNQKDRQLESVRPWRGYAAIHLWKRFAAELSKQKRSKT